MRFLELHLKAFGPFSDRRLDLSEGRQGLHIVYGPNEAGKSSALRALRALLFGVPNNTVDSFLHPYQDLRVGGRLQAADGSELSCYRRKGRLRTLLDERGEPVDEAPLRRLLGGLEERRFIRQFGIDHQALVAGGEELLAERGREAEVLFGSALGGARLHGLLEALDDEAKGLFARRAQNPLINAELRRLGEVEGRLHQASLKAGEWDEARRSLEVLDSQIAELDHEIARLGAERAALERLRRILPGLARRREMLTAVDALGPPPNLPKGFSKQRAEATSRLRVAAEGRLKAERRLADLHREADGLQVAQALLDRADMVGDLYARLDGYRKALRDRPGLIAEAESREREMRRQLNGLMPAGPRPSPETAGEVLRRSPDPDDLVRLRPLLARRRYAAELGARREALETAVATVGTELAETRLRLDEMRSRLAEIPDAPPMDQLGRAAEDARSAGDLDAALAEADLRLERHEETCRRDLAALGLWKGDLEALRALPLPGTESLRRFAEVRDALHTRRRELERLLKEYEREREGVRESLDAADRAGRVPGEDDLERARRHREQGWGLVRRQWLHGEDLTAEVLDYGAGVPLADAFEDSMRGADLVADRLRREAGRVHERAAARAALETLAGRIVGTETALAQSERERANWEEEWRVLWAPSALEPSPPAEMSQWLAQAQRLCEKALAGDELRATRDDLAAKRDRHRGAIEAALAGIGESGPEVSAGDALSIRLHRADVLLTALEDVARQRSELFSGIGELENQERTQSSALERAVQALESWRRDWRDLTREMGMEETAGPGDLSDFLETITRCDRLAAEAAGLRERLEAIDRYADGFRGDLRGLLADLARDLATDLPTELRQLPVDEAVSRLQRWLNQQRGMKSRRDEILAQARRAEAELSETEAERQAAEGLLRDLCRQAVGAAPEQLEEVERRDAEHRRLSTELALVEKELLDGGDGLGLDDLEARARDVDRDVLPVRIAAVGERIDSELQPRRRELLERQINARRDFDAMAGGDDAAHLAEESARIRARLRSLSERYLRARLAARVLRDEIERFRCAHRDPILARAGTWFESITLGAFTGVGTDFDGADRPVLVGLRANGEHLRVEAMSTGTRDQLYLSLRLATLERDLGSAEPLPFIVDDVLIQFDDRRAGATLQALTALSDETQVILFTHHLRDLEQARNLNGADGRVYVHEIRQVSSGPDAA